MPVHILRAGEATDTKFGQSKSDVTPASLTRVFDAAVTSH